MVNTRRSRAYLLAVFVVALLLALAVGYATGRFFSPGPLQGGVGAPPGRPTPTVRPAQPGVVSVTATEPLGIVPGTALGVNVAVWEPQLLTSPRTAPMLSAVPFRLFRYPGGKTADTYHWRQHCYSANPPCSGGQPNGGGQELNTFDNFMGLIGRVGGKAMVTVNYGTNLTNTGPGDPQEAADWVTYAITRGYDVAYWEIGNEQYFACDTGGEANLWPDNQGCADGYKAPNDTSYAAHAPAFAQAMTAAAAAQHHDIKIGVDVWEQWPSFSQNVISSTCPWLSFVDFHPYAQYGVNGDGTNKDESDAGLLANAPSTIAGYIHTLRAWIQSACPSRAGRIEIIAGELNNDSVSPGKQSASLVNALYAADVVPTLMEGGTSSAMWWNLYNGPSNASKETTDPETGRPVYGRLPYGDYGLLSSGQDVESYGAGWPFPPYYGLREAGLLLQPGATMVASSSAVPLVAAHATLGADGALRLLLINKSPTAPATVPLRLTGFIPSGAVTAYAYGAPQAALAPASDNPAAALQRAAARINPASPSYTLPPYSMALLVLEPAKQPAR